MCVCVCVALHLGGKKGRKIHGGVWHESVGGFCGVFWKDSGGETIGRGGEGCDSLAREEEEGG